ncbi:MAG: hypothetical protein RLZZ511_1930 [Cyanobacteriota bacterium]|jgi:hypothetical protein
MTGFCTTKQKSQRETPDFLGWAVADRQLAQSENQGFEASPFGYVGQI